jgi:hypothetical protein
MIMCTIKIFLSDWLKRFLINIISLYKCTNHTKQPQAVSNIFINYYFFQRFSAKFLLFSPHINIKIEHNVCTLFFAENY